MEHDDKNKQHTRWKSPGPDESIWPLCHGYPIQICEKTVGQRWEKTTMQLDIYRKIRAGDQRNSTKFVCRIVGRAWCENRWLKGDRTYTVSVKSLTMLCWPSLDVDTPKKRTSSKYRIFSPWKINHGADLTLIYEWKHSNGQKHGVKPRSTSYMRRFQ